MVTRDKITAYNNSAGEAPAELCLRLIRFYDFLYLLLSLGRIKVR